MCVHYDVKLMGVLSNIMYGAKKLTDGSLILCMWLTDESVSVQRENSSRQALIGWFKHTQTPTPFALQGCKCSTTLPGFLEHSQLDCFTAISVRCTGVWKYTPTYLILKQAHFLPLSACFPLWPWLNIALSSAVCPTRASQKSAVLPSTTMLW